jgi:serine/threonine protein phosphatase 1
MANTYAIADLHGRYDLLTAGLKLMEADAAGEPFTFICLGDFVDRGPQAKQIIELFIKGPPSPTQRWIILQGNHEDIMLQALGNPALMGWWMRNGGGRTLMSYGYQDGDQLTPFREPLIEHLNWLQLLPLTYEDGQRIFVHAGVPADKHINEVKPGILQWMLHEPEPDEEHYGDGDYYPDEPHISGHHVVHGHHQSANFPLLKPWRTNLDAFAWYTGRLAIGVFDDSQPQPVRIIEVKGPPHV